MPDVQTALPWSSDRGFSVWLYGISHSRLALRSYNRDWSEYLEILFVDVRWMEVGRGFRGGITLTEAAGPSPRPAVANCPYPLLLTELRGPEGDVGFVAAPYLRIRRMSAADEVLDTLLAINKAPRDD